MKLVVKNLKIYFLVNFWRTHPPLGTFVANTGQSAIRPSGDRAVEPAFSLRIALESVSIFFARPDCRFYSLINSPAGLSARPILTDSRQTMLSKTLGTQVRLSGSEFKGNISYFVRSCQELVWRARAQ